MQKNLLLISLFVILLISGCSSIPPASVDAKLNAWQGSNINTLIQTWGLPSQELEINGVKYAQWNTREIKNKPAVNIGLGGFGNHIFGSIGTTIFGGNEETHCNVQVGYNSEGVVTTANWSGDPNACDAAIPARSS